jgi:hypothetical protein
MAAMKILALIFAVLLSLAPTVAAAKELSGQTAYGYIILPQKRDRIYQLKSSIEEYRAFRSQLHVGIGDYYASHTISPGERNELVKEKITFLTIADGADKTLLEDRKLFAHLKQVSLANELLTEQSLAELALHHAGIRSISISQKYPLTDKALKLLKAFRRLEYLSLACPVANPALVQEALPRHLQWLRLHNILTLPALSDLRQLDLDSCQLAPEYLGRLHTPKLEMIKLFRVGLQPDSLSALSQFKHLRELYTCHCTVDEPIRQYLRAQPYLRVQIQD